VVGVIGIIAAQILYSSVHGSPKSDDQAAQAGPAAVLYMLALAVLYKFANKYAPLLLLACAAIAGQFLFV
jgi:hypothetical protein